MQISQLESRWLNISIGAFLLGILAKFADGDGGFFPTTKIALLSFQWTKRLFLKLLRPPA
jgi:hypothetical protein